MLPWRRVLVLAPFVANQSCDPFTSPSKPCTLGNYVVYAVEAQSAADIIAAVKFAKQNNIRFVIRNTGHDYLGRSTGAGALSFREWKGKDYTGSAVKLGAGVQGFQVLSAALEKKQVVVGGECPTVGIAGGYTQGGGHSALSTSFGRRQHARVRGRHGLAHAERRNLYWALSGAMVVYYSTSSFFQIAPLTAYNKTAAEVEAMLSPFAAKLTAMGVKYTLGYSQSATYYDHYDKYFGPLPVGNIEVGIAQYGGRLVPLSTFANDPAAMSAVTR
ncbi:hypothetical protein MYCTH_2125728 [Thermothelomyces thermophilus ATCC 42464]|uniref:FAD linked oxidase N-terminal domain-containing protein n=1 Tax=Thermothelomyces thermophilus (strain ATCC 42464 / BCRC 31852 / DSM 1799) TaxID=573729 RepID=G2QAP7_THET4|nr:uncharacterized protein MYCTH_2125728 [Thermothelomyces thermophilus ATCC 42464]AEO56743.1 hypothetical protein MYCTH_2125728 [Thermothelomyces thermophilus ATCC 42464]